MSKGFLEDNVIFFFSVKAVSDNHEPLEKTAFVYEELFFSLTTLHSEQQNRTAISV